MSTIENSLRRATASTFEDLGFLLTEEELTEEQAAAEVDTAVVVEFAGPYSGFVEVRLTASVLGEFVTNMLGLEGTPTPDELRDALGEIGNVICGNTLPLVAGTREIFHLSPPAAFIPAESPCEAGELVGRIVLGIDEGRAEVAFRAAEPVLVQGS